MKKWNAPEVTELNINETAQNWCGNSWDGGYIGDGHIGVLEWADGDKGGDKGGDDGVVESHS